MTATTKAFEQATAEGLYYFAAWTHVGGDRQDFLGHSWEDGGFRVNDAGEPTHDSRGNTVSRFVVEDLDQGKHAEAIESWYGE